MNLSRAIGDETGVFADMTIREDATKPFDFSEVDTLLDEVVVGDMAHFLWRYRQAVLNLECRAACWEISQRLARTLGIG